MSEPTARDMATALAEVEHFPIIYFHCSRCRTPNCPRGERKGIAEEVNLTVEKVSNIIAAERARVLTLTPEEAGRLLVDARRQANVTPTAMFSSDPAVWPEHVAMAFLAALRARAEAT